MSKMRHRLSKLWLAAGIINVCCKMYLLAWMVKEAGKVVACKQRVKQWDSYMSSVCDSSLLGFSAVATVT
jgi:hypothetical protein